jgi:thioesterase domain-containing protein
VRRAQYRGWRRMIGRTQFKIHLLKFEYAYLQQLNRAQARDYVAGRAAQKFTRMKDSVRQALKMTDPASNGRGAYGNPVDVLYTAAGRYVPRAYDGKVVLVRCQKRAFGFSQLPDLGWRDLLGENLEIRESPGNHYTLYMHPNVDALALNINVCLRRAEERAAEGARSAASR